jgi:S-adenosylmethionine uptake transporter
MGVTVKLASSDYGTGEIVFYRGLTGALLMLLLSRAQGTSLRTSMPGMHFSRGASGVCALTLWFYAIGGLPLATAITLNYMSSVWMALFLIGGAVMMGAVRVDGRLVMTVMLGFAGVALILRPTMEHNQLWHGLTGLLSGMLSAMAYLQVTALGRAGEPEIRVVFYFSLGGMLVGACLTAFSGVHALSWRGAGLLLATGLLAAVAQLLMTRAYAVGRPLVNASLQYMGIVFSFIYGVWLFNDPVTGMALAGMVLIVCAGVGAALLRNQAAPQSGPPSAES